MMVSFFLVTIIFSLLVLANTNLARSRSRVMLLQAQYSAESGADSAIANLNNTSDTYSGSGGEITVLSNNLYRATYTVTVSPGADAKERIINSVGKIYAPANS